jgi:hypothetical protein
MYRHGEANMGVFGAPHRELDTKAIKQPYSAQNLALNFVDWVFFFCENFKRWERYLAK